LRQTVRHASLISDQLRMPLGHPYTISMHSFEAITRTSLVKKTRRGLTRSVRHLLVLFALLLVPSALWAHASLVKSAPAQRAVLYRSPSRIQLWFNERLESKYSSLSVSDAEGKTVPTGKAEVSVENPKRLSALIKPLPPGRYIVSYRVLSVDGHIVKDQFPFTVAK
jgi:methionine-rich copper-binding protein CopC